MQVFSLSVVLVFALSSVSAFAGPAKKKEIPAEIKRDIASAVAAGKASPGKIDVTHTYKIAKYGAEWCGWCNYQKKVVESYFDARAAALKKPPRTELVVTLGGRNHAVGYSDIDVDKAGLSDEQLDALGVKTFPTTIIESPSGKKRFIEGYANIERLTSEIKKMAEEELASPKQQQGVDTDWLAPSNLKTAPPAVGPSGEKKSPTQSTKSMK